MQLAGILQADQHRDSLAWVTWKVGSESARIQNERMPDARHGKAQEAAVALFA